MGISDKPKPAATDILLRVEKRQHQTSSGLSGYKDYKEKQNKQREREFLAKSSHFTNGGHRVHSKQEVEQQRLERKEAMGDVAVKEKRNPDSGKWMHKILREGACYTCLK